MHIVKYAAIAAACILIQVAESASAQEKTGSVFTVQPSNLVVTPKRVEREKSYVSLWLTDSNIYAQKNTGNPLWDWITKLAANDRAVVNVRVRLGGDGAQSERVLGATNIEDIVAEATGDNNGNKRRFNIAALQTNNLLMMRPRPVRAGETMPIRMGFYASLLKDKFVKEYVSVVNKIANIAGFPQLGEAAKPQDIVDLYETASNVIFGTNTDYGKVLTYFADDAAYSSVLKESGYLLLSPDLKSTDAAGLRVVDGTLNSHRLYYYSAGRVGVRVTDKTFALIEVRVEDSRVGNSGDWRSSLPSVAKRYDDILQKANRGESDSKAVAAEVQAFRKWLFTEAFRELTETDIRSLAANLSVSAQKAICGAQSLSAAPECNANSIGKISESAFSLSSLPLEQQGAQIDAFDASLFALAQRSEYAKASKWFIQNDVQIKNPGQLNQHIMNAQFPPAN
jgi:hypothetical protein